MPLSPITGVRRILYRHNMGAIPEIKKRYRMRLQRRGGPNFCLFALFTALSSLGERRGFPRNFNNVCTLRVKREARRLRKGWFRYPRASEIRRGHSVSIERGREFSR